MLRLLTRTRVSYSSRPAAAMFCSTKIGASVRPRSLSPPISSIMAGMVFGGFMVECVDFFVFFFFLPDLANERLLDLCRMSVARLRIF